MDSVFATLHIGIIGFDLDIFKAELCMKGQIEVFKILNGYENIDRNMFFIEYELNILKVSFIISVQFQSKVHLYSCVLPVLFW